MGAALQKYMVLTFGYSDLVGIVGSGGLQRVRNEISTYNLYSVIQSITKMSSLLASKGMASMEAQVEFLIQFFTVTQRLKYFELAKAKAQGTPWVIVHQQNLLVLLKIAMEVCPREGGLDIENKDLEKIGYLLLIINDEIYAGESDFGLILPKNHERESLRAALSRYHFFLAGERFGYKLGRYWWIIRYFRKNKPHNQDIDSLFLEATEGITLDDYISVVGALLVKFVNLVNKKDPISNWVTCKSKYFENTKLSRKSIDSVIELISMSVDEYQDIHNRFLSEVLDSNDSFFYNFYPLMRKPLIREPSGDCFVCPSIDYMNDKLTEGIYRTIETYLLENNRKTDAQTFSIAWGDTFEKYVCEAAQNAFGEHFAPDIRHKGNQILDGIIITPNFAFLIETKSFNWTFKALISGDKTSIAYSVKNLFATFPKKKGLAQIARFIDEYHKGTYADILNLNGKLLIPVLVISSPIPMDAYNRKMFETIAFENNSMPKGTDVYPFIILTVEEIEILEAISKEKAVGYGLDTLVEYSYSYYQQNEEGFVGDSISFKNFLYFRNHESRDRGSNNVRVLNLHEEMLNVVSENAFGKKLVKVAEDLPAKLV